MYVPSVIVLDFETTGLDYYRSDFRVLSAAFAWRGRNGEVRDLFLQGEEEIGEYLTYIQRSGIPIVVHNFQFECGVCLYRFPAIADSIRVDTMRLVQVADNGGKAASYQPKVETEYDFIDDRDAVPHSTGLSLVAAAVRWLPPELQNHKEPFYAWLRDNCGVKRGQEGANLGSLPPDQLGAYNVADARVTLALYERLTAELEAIGYDWRLDHNLYMSTARMVAKAKGVGAKVDRTALETYVVQVQAEIDAIEEEFRAYIGSPIVYLEASYTNTWARAAKTGVTQVKRMNEGVRFNVGSNLQLKHLFIDTLGFEPTFWTKPPKTNPAKPRKKEYVPSPSFKAAHLSTYGEAGELLVKRRKRLLVLQQAKALLRLSEHDGRWHWDLRACGTATGRMAGGRVM